MPVSITDDLVARLTDIAYQSLLQHGLRQPFVDVELDLWRQIRSALAENGTLSPLYKALVA